MSMINQFPFHIVIWEREKEKRANQPNPSDVSIRFCRKISIHDSKSILFVIKTKKNMAKSIKIIYGKTTVNGAREKKKRQPTSKYISGNCDCQHCIYACLCYLIKNQYFKDKWTTFLTLFLFSFIFIYFYMIAFTLIPIFLH